MNSNDIIDFMPVDISEIVECDGYVSVLMPCQPCYSQITEEILPYYSCEIRVYDGYIELKNVSLPYEGDLGGIEYKDGWRGCFLPFDFMAEGPVNLSFCNRDDDEPQIIIKGRALSLNILKKAGHCVSNEHGDFIEFVEV